MNESLSKPIQSNQKDTHDKLEAVVRRHLKNNFRRPYPDYSLKVFEQANQQVQDFLISGGKEIILDSFCGVGESTFHLAQKNPQALVIGIDKSQHRLNKHDATESTKNYALFRADSDDFWRLALEAKWPISQHCIFYPNPWPKAAQFKRRVAGSPLLPTLIKLGGRLELRSNWPVYVREVAEALTLAGLKPNVESFNAAQPITPFERKYSRSGHPIWRCHCQLG